MRDSTAHRLIEAFLVMLAILVASAAVVLLIIFLTAFAGAILE
jgi:hypothetical protein